MAVRWWRLIRLLPFPVILIVGIGMCTPAMATCSGHDDAMLELVEACPRAVALLGTGIRTARFGCACGETELGGSSGNANWQIGISGSKASGRIEYTALMTADVWRVTTATLDVGDERIDVMRCAGGQVAERPDPTAQVLAQTADDAVTASLDGKVVRSTHAQIVDGASCSGGYARAKGSPTAHVTLTCGGIRLYDGLAGFRFEVGDPRSQTDDAIGLEDGAATAVDRRVLYRSLGRTASGAPDDRTPGLRMQGRTLTLWDGAPAFEITVAVSD